MNSTFEIGETNKTNNPKGSSGTQSGPSEYPNNSFERFSIETHIRPVRRPQGWNLGAERLEAYLQITSFTRVEGRITHSSHSSVQDPSTWVSYRWKRDVGQGQGGCQTWLTKPY